MHNLQWLQAWLASSGISQLEMFDPCPNAKAINLPLCVSYHCQSARYPAKK